MTIEEAIACVHAEYPNAYSVIDGIKIRTRIVDRGVALSSWHDCIGSAWFQAVRKIEAKRKAKVKS